MDDAEASRNVLAQGLYAETLGRMMARGQVDHACLARQMRGSLGNLAADEGIRTGVDRLLQHVLRGPGAPGDRTQRPFERAHGQHLDAVTEEQIRATGELLSLDEELRRSDPAESLDTDDVIAMEQPHILGFIHEHIDATLDAHAEQIDVDDVHSVYRVVLVEILALSYAVRRPEGFPVAKIELLA